MYIDSKSNPIVYYSMIFLNPGEKLALQLGFWGQWRNLRDKGFKVQNFPTLYMTFEYK